ncbi:phosphomevalonate kinase [Streptomyces sp. NPDC010273]|uniref:phosphomevalonate kinase n=1 Tax=Streptomyces sp. NPDC010273 TaxID=3364829 RepID=UPI0036EE992E
MTAPAEVDAARTVVRRAPGKLFVAGEYAVVDAGNPAILVAVDRYITVTVTGTPGGSGGSGSLSGSGAPGNLGGSGTPSGPGTAHTPRQPHSPSPFTTDRSPTPDVTISSDLTPRPTAWRWHEGRLVLHGPGDGAQTRAGLAHVVGAVEAVGALLAERGLPVPELGIAVSSRLHEGGRKYGLGSSGAVTVAAVDAVAAFCGVELSAGERYRLAMLASARIDPKGSGGDLAASAWGGWILYRAPERAFVLDLARRVGIARTLAAPWPGHEVRRLPPPAGLQLEVGWTGEPVSTASQVAGLQRRGGRPDTAARQRYVRASNRLVEAAAGALEAGDDAGLLAQIRTAASELARLDEAVGLGIFTPRLRRLCAAAEAVGAAAKPSGAGGGDCGIALLDAAASRHICQVRRHWTAAGVHPLPVRPAAQRPERTSQP